MFGLFCREEKGFYRRGRQRAGLDAVSGAAASGKGRSKMPGFKNGRLSEDIKRELSRFIRDEIKDPRVRGGGGMLSIVRTELSGGNSHCRVYVSSIYGKSAAEEAVKGLESAVGLIKRGIADRLRLRKPPEFKFIADDSIEYSSHIIKTLDRLTT